MVEIGASDDDKVNEDPPPPLPLWQEIQKRTFTNWVNLRLSPSFINDLVSLGKNGSVDQQMNCFPFNRSYSGFSVIADARFVDLSNGLQLIKLIENLTERNLGRRNKRIEHVNQRLDNVSIALDFLHEKEGLNLTNIGPADIVGGNPKLILGLMWLLFRQYTIAKALPMLPHEMGQKPNDKARLLQWIRSKLPGTFPVSNLTSDWNDGFALAALVEGCVPGLNAGWRDWDPTTPLENTKKAMNLAKEHLSIDKMIAPEDLISSDVDEISVMAYLTNFPLMVEAKKSRGSLKNIDRHPIAGIRSAFEVRVIDPAHIPHVSVKKTDGHDNSSGEGADIPTEVTPTNDSRVYDVTYVPPTPGNYEIALRVAAPEETESTRPADSKVKVEAVDGPGLKGLNPHPFVGEQQNLRVYNANPQDSLRIEVIGPASSQISIPTQWNHQNREFEGIFTPEKAGHHSVNVLCNSRNIKGSPFPTRAQSLPKPEFWGRGICDSLRAGEEAVVFAEYPSHILPTEAQRFLEKAKLKVKSNNSEVPVKETVADNRKIFTYSPEDVCVHEVSTIFDDEILEKHSVNAQYPTANSRAFGPGTESGMAERKAIFVIDRAPNEEVQFAIEGPAPSELRRNDIDDKTAIVEYTPSAPGKYYVSVLDNHGQNVKDSPFAVSINETVEGFYPDRAKISDLPPIVRVNEVVEFNVDTRPAHSLVPTPSLEVFDPDCEKQETRVQQKHDNTYRCSFCPRIVGHHQVFVTLDDVTIPPCPVTVACVDPDKLIYSGPGFDSPAYCSPNQTHFVIDAKQAGPGLVEVEMVDNEEQKVDVEVMDEKDGSYTVKYRAPKPGAYKIKVVFAGFELPNFEINVQQPADVSGTRVEGLDNGDVVTLLPRENGSDLTESHLEPVVVEDDDFEQVTLPKRRYSTKGEFPLPTKGDLIQGNEVTLLPSFSDASKCVATGKGLSESIIGEIAEFKIDTSEAGEGDLAFAIKGPNTATTVVDYTPGSCSAIYTPTQPGDYEISVKFGRDEDSREHIPGSPFDMVADYTNDPNRIIVIDPASTNGNNKVAKGVPGSFIVDATQTQKQSIAPVVKSLGPRDEVTAHEIDPRIWKIDYTFNEPTNRRIPIDLRYGDEVLPIGPFVEIVDALPENLKILGIQLESPDSLKTNIEFDAKDVGNFEEITGKVINLDDRNSEFDAVIQEKEPGVYSAVIHPKRAGHYGLKLFGDGTPISEGFIEFAAIKPGDSKKAFIRSTPVIWALNKPNDILIEHNGDDKSVSTQIKPNENDDIDVQIFTVDAADLYDSPMLDNKLTIVRLTPKKSQLFTGKLFHERQPIKNGDVTFVPNENAPPTTKRPGSPFSTTKLYEFAVGPENEKKQLQTFMLNPDKELITLDSQNADDSGHMKVKATFDQPGKHILFVLADGKLLPKHVVQEIIKKPVAYAHGPGLESAIVGERATFDIVSPDRGQVKVNVKGPKSVKIEMEQKQENSCTVHWTPDVVGTYEVLVYVNQSDTPAAGSPYFVKADNAPSKGRKTSCFSCASPSEVTFDCGKDVNKENLTATVTGPDGSSSKCGVRLLDNSKIGLTLRPKTIGDYKFHVLERGKELPHSPFLVKVTSLDFPDPSQVQLYGEGLRHGIVGVENEFYIDCQKAGYGSVLVSIDGPADAPMSCIRTDDKLMKILYNPPVAGTYQINVNFDDKIVPSCPYFVECRKGNQTVLLDDSLNNTGGQSKTVIKDNYVQQITSPQRDFPQHQLNVQSPGSQSLQSQQTSVVSPVLPLTPTESRRRAEIDLYVPKSESSQLTTIVVDPKGNEILAAVANLGKGYHSLQFKVTERGRYSAHVYQNNQEIQGSPFSFIAGAKKHGNAENIKVTGTGLETAQAAQPQSFMIHTAEAGPGVVNVVIDGPEKPLTKLKDLKDGRVFVEYTAHTPGHYFITILFNGVSVRTTPYCVYVAPAKSSKHKKNGTCSKGVSPLAPTVEIEKRTVPQTSKSSTSTAKLSGRGLSRGTTGSITEFDILPLFQEDTIYAVEVHGPSKVKITTENTVNGIKVKFVPYAPGEYNISVKNNGTNVTESPSRCKVDGASLGGNGINETTVIYARYISQSSTTVTKYEKTPLTLEYIDQEVIQKTETICSAKNVVIDGQGKTQFIPGKPAMFKIFNIGCETLFVGVVTAHGPCQQCSVTNCGDGSFLVTYVINDRTPGFVYIRYGTEDVPGSPFKTFPASR